MSLEKFEDTKGVFGIRKSKNGMAKKKEDKRTNDKQNITQKTEDREIRIPLKTDVNSGASEWLTVPAPHVTLVVKYTTILMLKQFIV